LIHSNGFLRLVGLYSDLRSSQLIGGCPKVICGVLAASILWYAVFKARK